MEYSQKFHRNCGIAHASSAIGTLKHPRLGSAFTCKDQTRLMDPTWTMPGITWTVWTAWTTSYSYVTRGHIITNRQIIRVIAYAYMVLVQYESYPSLVFLGSSPCLGSLARVSEGFLVEAQDGLVSH